VVGWKGDCVACWIGCGGVYMWWGGWMSRQGVGFVAGGWMNVRGWEGGEKNVNCSKKCIMSDVNVQNEVKKTFCHVCDSCACRSAGRWVLAFSRQARDQLAP
jgi:hypothetical protein